MENKEGGKIEVGATKGSQDPLTKMLDEGWKWMGPGDLCGKEERAVGRSIEPVRVRTVFTRVEG